ncbi:MAG: tetratricopeptide repeat protein [Saprospiraceae bacterium]|nr:tetratricopeptide repeat protein [Saprospiraceae bacterium]
MYRPLLLYILLFFSSQGTLSAFSSPYYEWSPLAREAYEKVTELRLIQAANLLQQLRKEEPDNLLSDYLENYLDFFRVYINEDKEEFDILESHKDDRIDRMQEGDASSPWHLYTQANIRLQWALARLKFEEYATAFFEVNKAMKLLNRNDKLFPDFMPNKKDLGILHAMAGTIPDGYKWAVEWLSSMEGSIKQGQRELEEVIAYARTNDFIFEKEIYVFYAYLMLHLNQNEEAAWGIINESNLDPARDPMACFIVANIAMRTGRNDEAIDILEHRPGGRVFHPFYYLEYMLGIAKQRRLDADAGIYFQHYVEQFQGRNFIKDAYQKLAWQALLQGNVTVYQSTIQNCLSKGYTIVGSDVSAMEEAKSGIIPQVDLLKARILFDGGYFKKAENILQQKSRNSFTQTIHQIEYSYRLGRIYQAQGKTSNALKLYRQTIDEGRDYTWYFACRAALETGIIYEASGNTPAALDAFNECLSIKPNEHRTALHQAAKAGINRLSN